MHAHVHWALRQRRHITEEWYLNHIKYYFVNALIMHSSQIFHSHNKLTWPWIHLLTRMHSWRVIIKDSDRVCSGILGSFDFSRSYSMLSYEIHEKRALYWQLIKVLLLLSQILTAYSHSIFTDQTTLTWMARVQRCTFKTRDYNEITMVYQTKVLIYV